MRSIRSKNKVLPGWAIWAILIVCGGLTYFLIPSERVLLERQVEDGRDAASALATLRKLPDSEKARNPANYALLELKLTRKTLKPKNTNEIHNLIIKACREYGRFSSRREFLNEIEALLQMSRQPDKDFEAMSPHLVRFPYDAQLDFIKTTAEKALANNQPVLSAELRTLLLQKLKDQKYKVEVARYLNKEVAKLPEALQVETLELIKLWRAAAKPEKGLEILVQHEKTLSGDLFKEAPEFARLKIDLHRELGQTAEAFDLVNRFYNNSEGTAKEGLFELWLTIGREANKIEELFPIVKKKAEEAPQDLKLWETYGDLASGSTNTIKYAIDAYQKLCLIITNRGDLYLKLAQTYEWSNQPEAAFNTYLIALKLKQEKAIDRLLDLNPGLYRHTELAEAFNEQTDMVNNSTRLLDLTRLQMEAGNFDRALRGYEQLIQTQNQNTNLFKEYGQILMRLYEFEKALVVYKKAEQMSPKDKSILKANAEILYHMGNYEDSFKYYELLIADSPNIDVLESYAALAEALGQLNKLAQSIEVRISLSTNVISYDYHQLAYSRKLLGQTNAFIATLKEGLKRFPDDASLRLQTVLALQETEQFDQAAEYLIKHPELKKNAELLQMYIGLLVSSQKLKEAEAFFAKEVPSQFRTNPGLLESEAYVYESLKQPENALKIYAKLRQINPTEIRYTANYARMLCLAGRYKEALPFVPMIESGVDKERLHLLAQIHAAASKFKLAEDYQKQYIASRPENMPQAWGFLGDIYLSRGEKTMAKRAYQRGLDELKSQLSLKRAL